jgi:hypothetical protein
MPVRAPGRQVIGRCLVISTREVEQRTPAGPKQLKIHIPAGTVELDIIYKCQLLGE